MQTPKLVSLIYLLTGTCFSTLTCEAKTAVAFLNCAVSDGTRKPSQIASASLRSEATKKNRRKTALLLYVSSSEKKLKEIPSINIHLLDKDKFSFSEDVNHFTELLLDDNNECYPMGSLSKDILNNVTHVIEAWTKTCSTDGATIVQAILERLEAEKRLGNDKVMLTSQMFCMVGHSIPSTFFLYITSSLIFIFLHFCYIRR